MTSNSEKRPPIPSAIQREVRQRCGFGCVICGLPLYEYEHMEEWAQVRRHVASEITLLCDRHHREKTSGLMPTQVVAEANRNPFNFRSGVSKPYDLYYSGDYGTGSIGGNRFISQLSRPPHALHFITIDGVSLLNFTTEDNHLFLNVNLFDELGRTILVIEKNTLVFSVDTWDITLIGKNLVIRQASRNILLDITFNVPNEIVVNRAHVSLNGVELDIHPDYLDLIPSYLRFGGNVSIGANIGIRIGQRIGNSVAAFGIDEPVRHPSSS